MSKVLRKEAGYVIINKGEEVMRISTNLKFLREKNKVSRKALAKAAGVSDITVYNWEVGKTEPTLTALIAISDFFGIKIDSLVTENLADKKSFAPRRKALAPIPEVVGNHFLRVDECPCCKEPLAGDAGERFCRYCGQEFKRGI